MACSTGSLSSTAMPKGSSKLGGPSTGRDASTDYIAKKAFSAVSDQTNSLHLFIIIERAEVI